MIYLDYIANALGLLSITLLSFSFPVLSISLSFFPRGVQRLKEEYKNIISQSEENFANQSKKRDEGGNLDLNALEKNLKELRTEKGKYERRLPFLTQPKAVMIISVPLLTSFLLFSTYPATANFDFKLLLFVFAILALTRGIYALYTFSIVLTDAAHSSSATKDDEDQHQIELLSKIVESKNNSDSLFVNEKEVFIKFGNSEISGEEESSHSIGKQHSIPIAITNRSKTMIKKVEVGFIFPSDILVEESPSYSIATAEEGKIVRFKEEYVQGNTNAIQKALKITVLNEGIHVVKTFIKAENVKANYRDMRISGVA